MGSFRYRNENNDEVVELDEVNEDLEQRSNWHRLDGEGDVVEVAEGELTEEELVADLKTADDDTVLALYNAALNEGVARGLITEAPATEDSEEAVEAAAAESEEGSAAAQTSEPNATDAALKLAKDEGIDIATVTGTGDGGRIGVGDVRKAVEAAAA